MEERRRVREERERARCSDPRGREKEKARGWERERKNDRERNIACAESPVQTLSRAFSIMQIESDWLRSGFSTAVLSFRAPEFSPRYASYPLCPPSPTPLVSLLSFLRAFARPCSTSETNGRRATARALSGRQPNFPWLSFLPGRTELLKSFDGPSDSWIYIARLMHVAVGEVGRGKRYAGGR